MNRISKILVVWTFLALALVLVPAAEATNGYFVHGYGTVNKAMAGAGVALPQDSMAAATNPAGMPFVGKRYDAGLAIFNPNREYIIKGNPSGFPGTFGLVPGNVDSESEYFFVPHFGANWMLSDSMTLGLVLYGHGGMNTDWPTATFYAGRPTGVDLSQLFIGIPWAVKFAERHAFSIMPLFSYQQFELKGAGSFAPFSANPAKLSNNGTDDSTGYGAKIAYFGQWTDRFSFGVSYQTEMEMDEFSEYAGLFAEQGGFNIPSTLTAGFAIKASDALTFVFDYQEINYSDIKSVNSPLLPNLVQARLGDDNGAGFGWQDIEVFKLGFQYDAGNSWVWRFGFSTTDQPIPETEVLFNILAPGVVEEHYTLGFTKKMGARQALNLSLMYAPEVNVEGPNPLEVPGLQTIELAMDQWDLEISYSWGF
jgi:long-chain fatty acid transport protein